MHSFNVVLPQIIRSFEDRGRFYCVICFGQDMPRYYRFGISRAGHVALQNLLAYRPFDTMPGLQYLYYLDDAASDDQIVVYIVQDRNKKKFVWTVPPDFARTCKWWRRHGCDVRDARKLAIDARDVDKDRVSRLAVFLKALFAK